MEEDPLLRRQILKNEVTINDHCRFIVSFEMQMHTVQDTDKIQRCLGSALNDRHPFLRCLWRVNVIFFDL